MNKIQQMRPMMGSFIEIGIVSNDSDDLCHVTDAFELMANVAGVVTSAGASARVALLGGELIDGLAL